ncbi:MAG: hypothetical protein ACX94C_07850 [Phycisphaerales bacterium]
MKDRNDRVEPDLKGRVFGVLMFAAGTAVVAFVFAFAMALIGGAA